MIQIPPQLPAPMVSVIVPTYNRPELLTETIRSILAQSYQDFEILVVNDSGQDVEDIVSELNKGVNKIVYIKHARNKGPAAARNTGIKASRGKYIAYLDDDDIFYPDHLETLVNFLEKGDYRVAYTDAYRAHLEKKDGIYVVTKRDVPYSFDFDYEKILTDNFIPTLCFMHDRLCVEEAGLFDETLENHEDWDLWIRMSRIYKFAHIKALTCEFAWKTDGSTLTSSQEHKYEAVRQRIRAKYSRFHKVMPTEPDHAKAGANLAVMQSKLGDESSTTSRK
jgi:glycosyltransferase involved in cell wall biosynthesis